MRCSHKDDGIPGTRIDAEFHRLDVMAFEVEGGLKLTSRPAVAIPMGHGPSGRKNELGC